MLINTIPNTIIVDASVFPVGDHPSVLTIDVHSPSVPLSNPFRVGHQSSRDGSLIRTREDVQEAYRHLLEYKITSGQPHVITQLDEIGFAVLDGEPVVLRCTCADEDTCHGQVTSQIIMNKLNETKEYTT